MKHVGSSITVATLIKTLPRVSATADVEAVQFCSQMVGTSNIYAFLSMKCQEGLEQNARIVLSFVHGRWSAV